MLGFNTMQKYYLKDEIKNFLYQWARQINKKSGIQDYKYTVMVDKLKK